VALTAALVAAVSVGDLAAATPKEQLAQKRAQESRVLAEVQSLDRRFGATVEAWNGARYELAQVRTRLALDLASFRSAQRQQRIVQLHVRQRLVALYESDSSPTALSIILGSQKLGDMIDELAAVQQVAAADNHLAAQATQARDRYAAQLRALREAEHRRQAAVSQLATERMQIGSLLSRRRTLLSSITTQIASLRVAEARRQAALAAAARARLAREQEQLRRQAAEREAAARAQKQQQEQKQSTPAAPPPATTTAEAPPATTTAPTPLVATPPPADATTTTAPLPASAPSAGAGHPEAATIALRYLGVRYRWGGATPAGFDCSGLVMYVYAQLGIALPHYAAAQFGMGQPVSRAELQPGDLVFFDGLNHVGIYIGGGQVVHAPQTGDVVKISSIADWGAGYVGARRI
jgi:peptidoglycan DL-endopeptidase CwlO